MPENYLLAPSGPLIRLAGSNRAAAGFSTAPGG